LIGSVCYHTEPFWSHLARAQFIAKRYADAIESLRHIAAPGELHHALLAACYARMDDTGQAAVHAAEVMKRNPEFTIRTHYLPTLHYRSEADLPDHLETLRKAGLPD
jgi:adenylate cyclase